MRNNYKDIPEELWEEVTEDTLFEQAEQGQKQQPNTPPVGQPQEPASEEEGSEFNLGNLLDPEFAVDLIDIAMPPIAVAVTKWMTGKKIDKKQLQANQREKEMMQEPVKLVLQELKIYIKDPFVKLAVVLLAIYGIKAASLAAMTEKTTKSTGQTDSEGNEVKKGRGRPRKN